MRVGMVNRTDLPKGIEITDIENSSQRNFSSQPKGQSRTLRRPTDAEVQSVINAYAIVCTRGTDTNATRDTSTNKTLRIKTASGDAFTVITVTSGATTAKTRIRDDLNIGFKSNGLKLHAVVAGTNQIQIETTVGNVSIIIDTTANGSNLNTAVGFAAGGVTVNPITKAALRTAVYPSGTTIDVSSATIVAISAGFTNLSTSAKAALSGAVADLIAPHFVETSLILLSFSSGSISKAAAAAFRPGGARGGLSAGIALAAVADDGSTPFTL